MRDERTEVLWTGGYLALLMGHPALGLRLLPKSILTMYPISDP